MRFLTITLVVHAPDPVTGVQKSTGDRQVLELFQSDIAPTLRRHIPDPPWTWGPAAAVPVPATV